MFNFAIWLLINMTIQSIDIWFHSIIRLIFEILSKCSSTLTIRPITRCQLHVRRSGFATNHIFKGWINQTKQDSGNKQKFDKLTASLILCSKPARITQKYPSELSLTGERYWFVYCKKLSICFKMVKLLDQFLNMFGYLNKDD